MIQMINLWQLFYCTLYRPSRQWRKAPWPNLGKYTSEHFKYFTAKGDFKIPNYQTNSEGVTIEMAAFGEYMYNLMVLFVLALKSSFSFICTLTLDMKTYMQQWKG